MSEPTTTSRITFFINTCFIVCLPFIAAFQWLLTFGTSSSVFALPMHRHSACVLLPVQKPFLSDSQSCTAKIRFPLATYFPLSALLLFRQRSLRWTYFNFSPLVMLDQSGQTFDRKDPVNENKRNTAKNTGRSHPCRFLLPH